MTATSVRVERLGFRYPDGHPVLDGVDLDVAAGERVAILGPNGAGKTTLLLHLNGILTPSTGRVVVGEWVVERPTLGDVRRTVGFVFQDPGDQLFLRTVRDDVAFGPANLGRRGDDLERRVVQALEAVGLPALADRSSHHLSLGEQRRIALATVLSMDPSVLVLDEPTSNLDPRARRRLLELLGGLEQTIVVATHDLPFALELCPRSVVLVDGSIVRDGPTRRLLADESLLDAAGLELPYALDPALLEEP